MLVTSATLQLKTKKYLETVLIIYINKICGKYNLVSYEYHDTGKTRLTWEGFKKVYEVKITGDLSIVNTIIKELKQIERGK